MGNQFLICNELPLSLSSSPSLAQIQSPKSTTPGLNRKHSTRNWNLRTKLLHKPPNTSNSLKKTKISKTSTTTHSPKCSTAPLMRLNLILPSQLNQRKLFLCHKLSLVQDGLMVL